MSGFVIEPAGYDLTGIRSLYQDVGFRPDLVDDLRFLRHLGGEIFVAIKDGAVVGASSCLPLEQTGWIGGVAVAPQARRDGLGSRLTTAALDSLHSRGVETALLHATPMARSLYTKLGFASDGELVELSGPAVRGRVTPHPEIRPGTSADLEAALALDRTATGEDRQRLIADLWEGGASVINDGTLRGFHIRQLSSAAGAVVAADRSAGEALLVAALTDRGGPLRVAVPERTTSSLEILAVNGYGESGRTTRMHLGPAVPRQPALIYSAFNMFWG